MSNVVINRDKIDILANAIADKSGYPLPMTLDELLAAVDSIKVCPQDEGGGGGGGTPELKIVRKTDSDIISMTGGEIRFSLANDNMGDYVDGTGENVRAFILYRTAASTPSNGRVVAVVKDSQGAESFYMSSNGTTYKEEADFGGRILEDNGTVYFAVEHDETSQSFITDSKYGVILICGGENAITFRKATTTPASGQTRAQFTSLAGEPVLYLVGLKSTVTTASYHRVNSVAYRAESPSNLLCGTNFYTNNIGFYTNFTSSYSGTTLTVASNGTSGGGYFHNPGNYCLYYLIASDLETQ